MTSHIINFIYPRWQTLHNNQFARGSLYKKYYVANKKQVLVGASEINKKLIHQLVTCSGISV